MPHRPPSLPERLRSVWRQSSDTVRSPAGAQQDRDTRGKGSDFADRLRAAVTARH